MFITLSTVVYMMNQDVNLVADDYYDQEIKYQEQIDRLERTKKLDKENIITFDGSAVKIEMPSDLLYNRVEGEIYFYRPSNGTDDLKIPLTINSLGTQIVPVTALAKGLWTVKVNWTYSGKEYFNEKRIII